ncbi:MAG: hypothetical protein NVS4B2_21600 [Chloroflexota bacterium]
MLTQLGSVIVSRKPFNKTTCPYGGCGTVTAKFRAAKAGTAQVSATRVSCGEAMGCTGAAASYRLTVRVTAASSRHCHRLRQCPGQLKPPAEDHNGLGWGSRVD